MIINLWLLYFVLFELWNSNVISNRLENKLNHFDNEETKLYLSLILVPRSPEKIANFSLKLSFELND